MLVNLNDVKTFLGVSDASQDIFLQLQIELVSEAIEGYCHRKFLQNNYVQTIYREDLQDTKSLPLYHFPLIGAPTVKEKGHSGSETPVVDFRYNSTSGVLTKTFGTFFQNGPMVEVTYTAGYATLPAIIKHVLLSVVQERYNKKMNGIDLNFGSDVQRISIPGTISIDFDYSLNNNERKSHFGSILGSHLNVLDSFRSERTILGSVAYV